MRPTAVRLDTCSAGLAMRRPRSESIDTADNAVLRSGKAYMSRISPQGDQEPTRLAAMFGTLSDVWLRFLVAIIGLTAAFTAALFSTLARQSGNVTATAIFASVALLLACLVGLTTVPYLWRRVSVEHVRDAFDYEVTRAGVVYLALAVVLGLAAVNTGNNLLYLIVAAMLSAVVISGAASAVVLRAVEMDVHLPDHVFAERAVLARVTLRNRRTWLPAFSVSVVPPRKKKGSKQWHWEPSVFAFPAQRPPDQQWIRLPDRVLRRGPEQRGQAGILEGPVYFPYIPARQAISADVELVFARRGMYRQDNF